MSKPTPTAAEKLLADARANSPRQTYGVAKRGNIIVSWCRPNRTYDVGTAAASHANGAKRDVLPMLTRMLAAQVAS